MGNANDMEASVVRLIPKRRHTRRLLTDVVLLSEDDHDYELKRFRITD